MSGHDFSRADKPFILVIPRRASARRGSAVPDNRQLTTLFHAFRENGVVDIESEWTARERDLKMLGGPARTFLSPG